MLKLKVILSTVLRNFKVVPGLPQNEWQLQGDIILKRTDGFRIKLEPRKKSGKPIITTPSQPITVSAH